ncbi:MAG TPA: hypothetical protein VKB80_36175, partial [Kofleriaceae bacterium]|nr:hypothetical protein [Kofleriaceae bacterium]
AGRRALRGVSAVAALRRDADELAGIDQASWARDQLSFLRSQLAAADMSAREIVSLRSEHHRLDRILRASEAARGEIHAAEELALTAIFAGEELRGLSDEAADAMGRFRRAFYYVATAYQPVRDTCTMAIFDPERSCLPLWLGPLLDEAERRSWEIVVHVRGRTAEDDAMGWPADRAWSGPRSAEFARQRIAEAGLHDAVLLRAQGRDAGLLLAMEDGIHRFLRHDAEHPDRVGHLVLKLMTMRAELTDDDWTSEPMRAPPPERPRPGQAATRTREAGEDHVLVHEKDRLVEVPYAEYWPRFEEIALEDFRYHVAVDNVELIFKGHIEAWRAQQAARAVAAEDGEGDGP